MNSTSLFAPRALLRDGWASDVRVTIAVDGRIRGVERDVKPRSEDRCLIDRVLLPAPANVHSHAFQRALAGRTQRRGPGEDDFWSWRRLLYRFLEGLTPEMIGAITAQAQLEMCEAGYAAVAEFHYLHHAPGGGAYANPAEISERIMEAAQATGIGLSLLPVIYSTGGADGGAPAGVQLRFACDAEKYDLLWRSAASSLSRGPADWRIGIAPHSLRAVPRDILMHKLLAVLDWSARHLPEPEPASPDEAPHEAWDAEPVAEPAQPDYDGSEDEFHYGGESYVGSQETPEFRAWLEDLERRLGPVPLDDSLPDHLIDCTVGVRKFTGRLMTPEYRAWRDRQHRRAEAPRSPPPDSPGTPHHPCFTAKHDTS